MMLPRTDRPVGVAYPNQLTNREAGIRSFGVVTEVSAENGRKDRFGAARLLQNATDPWEGPVNRQFDKGDRGMRTFARIMLGAACLALWPTIASAQTSGIAGQVKDASGAVLPGVTVEAR